MKKIIFFLPLLLLTTILKAQSQSDYSYSAGLKLFSYGEHAKLLNEVRNSDAFKQTYLHGLIFKISDNQLNYRFSVSAKTTKNYSFINACESCETVEGKYKEFSLKLGLEKNVLYGIIQPYYGADLGYKKVNFSGESSYNTHNYDIEKNGVLVYPFIGFKVNLLKARITVSAETGMDIIYSYDKETTNTNGAISINKFQRWGFNNQPIGMLSLQYNFGY